MALPKGEQRMMSAPKKDISSAFLSAKIGARETTLEHRQQAQGEKEKRKPGRKKVREGENLIKTSIQFTENTHTRLQIALIRERAKRKKPVDMSTLTEEPLIRWLDENGY